MAGPNKQFDRQEALTKALEIFWLKGFEATSMQDLVNTMGINRASLYDTFGNKENLFDQALFNYSEQSLVNIQQVLQQQGSPLENIVNFFKMMGSTKGMLGHQGCFLNNTAVELGPHNPAIAKSIREQWEKIEALLKDTLDKAVELGELRPDIDTLSLAQFFNTLISGLAVQSKASVPAEKRINVVKIAFEMIQNAKKKA